MAAFTPNIPPSTILRSKAANDNEPRRQTKQEFRKQKELEEGRKAGTEPAMTDVETGRDINPHIPHYISNAPWYVNAAGPTLKHQKPHPERQTEFSGIYETYKKGVTNKVATKFRKGACENCGSITHTKKDCFERPRKIGARHTNEDIAPDEYLPESLTQTYDAKRDRWSGFDASEYSKVVDEFNRLDEARKIIKTADMLEHGDEKKSPEEKLENPVGSAENEDGVGEERNEEDEDLQDEDKYAEGADMPGVKIDHDSSTRITVRNLRIREDTAKYLYNLDPESAYYDPKSRAMREDPFKNVPSDKRPSMMAFKGDNFQRYTGEVKEADQGQIFAWEAQNKGFDVHSLAEPTKLEALRKEYETQKKSIKSNVESKIFEKYGGEEHVLLDEDTKRLIYQSQTETYTEYSRKGELVKGQEKPIIRSRYEEDFYPNNHTTIFGSHWSKGRWGYKCCKSFVKNSYCVGNLEQEKEKKCDEELTDFGRYTKTATAPSTKTVGDQSDSGSESESEESSSDKDDKNREDDVTSLATRQESGRKRADRKRRRRAKKREKCRKTQKKSTMKKRSKETSSSSESSDSASSSSDESEHEAKKLKTNSIQKGDLLAKALVKQARREEEGRLATDDRRRAYNSMQEVEPLGEVELEAYKLKKLHPQDPMAAYFEKK